MAQPRKVKVKYIKSHDYKTSFITGIHGGLASNGLINANFFADRVAMPDFQTLEIGDNNELLGTEDIKDSDMVREVQFGCYLDVVTTRLIINWLQARVVEFEMKNKK